MGGLDFTVTDCDQTGPTTPKDRRGRGRRNRKSIARASNGTLKVMPVQPARTDHRSDETGEGAVGLTVSGAAGPGDISSRSKRKQRIEVSATRRKGEKQSREEQKKNAAAQKTAPLKARDFSGWCQVLLGKNGLTSMSEFMDRKEWPGRWKEDTNKKEDGLADSLLVELGRYDYSLKVPTCLHFIVSNVVMKAFATKEAGKKPAEVAKLMEDYTTKRSHAIRYILQQHGDTHYKPRPDSDSNSKAADHEDMTRESESGSEASEDEEIYPEKANVEGECKSPQKTNVVQLAQTPLELAIQESNNKSVNLSHLLQLFVQELPQATSEQVHSWHSCERQGDAKKTWVHDLISSISTCDKAGLATLHALVPHLDPSIFEQVDSEKNTILHIVSRLTFSGDDTLQESHKSLIETILKIFPNALTLENAAFESPYLHRVNRMKQFNKPAAPAREQATPNDSKIAMQDVVTAFLKMQSMICEPLTTALRVLFGSTTARRSNNICLDLEDLAKFSRDKLPVKKSALKKYLHRLDLDDTLKYVRIPYFPVYDDDGDKKDSKHFHPWSSVASGAESAALDAAHKPPNHCEMVFSLLNSGFGENKDKEKGEIKEKEKGDKKKGDKKEKDKLPVIHTILEVVVGDKVETGEVQHTPAHANAAILRCLQPFSAGIQKWDWKKVDMCCDAIFKAAPNIRVLYLYSSGNNAVLKSWAGENGLLQFKKLEIIFLEICDPYVIEAPEDIRDHIHEFAESVRNRFKSANREITINYDLDRDLEMVEERLEAFEEMEGNPARSLTRNKPKQDGIQILECNEWLKKMHEFVTFVGNCNIKENEDGEEIVPRKIKVAVIDDGFTLVNNLDDFSKNEVYGASFCAEPDLRFQEQEFFSKSGHGTLMTQCIRKICPKAEFYIAKFELAPGTRGPTKMSATEAINWAIDSECHVISMSWTIIVEKHMPAKTQSEQERLSEVEELRKALKRAVDAKILLFGAASDRGNNISPHEEVLPGRAPEVFFIGAADNLGRPNEHVEPDCDFLLPGGDGNKEYQGSSFSTALAAGLAALILHCAEVSGFCLKYPTAREYLGTHRSMFEVLKGLCHDPQNHGKYIQASNFFNHDLIKGGWGKENRLRFIALVERILRPITDKMG